jgi:spermidine/putrescine transport system substrate-binding protein
MLLLILALAGILMLSVQCGGGKQKLYVYNWSYYIPEDVIREFEARFNVRVVYDVYSSNEEMYAKLKAGGKGYDVVFPSQDYASIMIKQGMALKLDKSKIPNFANLDKDILRKVKFDPNFDYSIPYMASASGIAVNKEFVKDYPRNFRIFAMEKYKGRMTMLDDAREIIGNALITLGYSAVSTNPKQLQEAKDLILSWKPNLQKFDSEAFGKGFANGEFWVVHGYGENIFLECDDEMKKKIDFFIPDVGGTMYIDSMLILKDARNVDLAHAFINFIHEPAVYAKITDYLNLNSINVPARALMKKKPIFDVKDLSRCTLMEDLGTGLDRWNAVWQEIRIEH